MRTIRILIHMGDMANGRYDYDPLMVSTCLKERAKSLDNFGECTPVYATVREKGNPVHELMAFAYKVVEYWAHYIIVEAVVVDNCTSTNQQLIDLKNKLRTDSIKDKVAYVGKLNISRYESFAIPFKRRVDSIELSLKQNKNEPAEFETEPEFFAREDYGYNLGVNTCNVYVTFEGIDLKKFKPLYKEYLTASYTPLFSLYGKYYGFVKQPWPGIPKEKNILGLFTGKVEPKDLIPAIDGIPEKDLLCTQVVLGAASLDENPGIRQLKFEIACASMNPRCKNNIKAVVVKPIIKYDRLMRFEMLYYEENIPTGIAI